MEGILGEPEVRSEYDQLHADGGESVSDILRMGRVPGKDTASPAADVSESGPGTEPVGIRAAYHGGRGIWPGPSCVAY